jgi:SAM-dependent methyltransferase
MRPQKLQDEYNRWHAERLAADRAVPLDPREARFFAWLLALLGADPGARLLDVACGQGKFLGYAQAHGLEVTGVDVSDVAVEAARARVPGATVLTSGAEELPFDESTFDFVTCIGSLEHFPDRAAGAAEMRRVLRPGGRAVVFVPNLFFLGHVWFGLRHGTQPSEGGQEFSEVFLSSQGWQDLLARAGFEVRGAHVWNHIFASQRVSPFVTRAWNALARFVPRNGAYAFAFVCGKASSS